MGPILKVVRFLAGESMLDEGRKAGSVRSEKEAAALERVEAAILALEGCKGELTPEGYVQLRSRLGHLMDTLYRVGEVLSKST
jgi:hypothetical protein